MIKDQTRKDVFGFLLGTTVTTWGCIFWMESLGPISSFANLALFTGLDFLENASPLLMALLLLRKSLFDKRGLPAFFLGTSLKPSACFITAALFLLQFLNFYLFSTHFHGQDFLFTLISQLLLGGGLEEAGWRGYLLPVLRRKLAILPASILVSLTWVGWHLPYFFLPGSMQQGTGPASYLLIGVITGLGLTAIYVLTESVLLCTAFHSFQNALVMTCGADTGSLLFQAIFLAFGILSALICVVATAGSPQPPHQN